MADNVSLHQYRDGILVEVILDNGNGNVSTQSVEFDVVDPEQRVLSPKTELPDSHEDAIRERLAESDYALAGHWH